MVRFSRSFKQLPRYVKKRSFKGFDNNVFKSLIAECGLEDVLKCTDVNTATDVLTTKIKKILDIMAPVKKFQTRTRYAPWMSKEAKLLKEKRQEEHKKASETDHPEDWRHFRGLRNQTTAKLREDKKRWEEEKLDLEQNNSAGVWKAVKGWLGWGSSGTPTNLFWEGRMVSSPSGLASTMNRFFHDKIRKLRSDIPPPTGDPINKLREDMKEKNCTFSIKEVSVEEVTKLIHNLKNSSSTGIDYIDTKTIKLVAKNIAPALSHIINLSVKTSTFPSLWKWAKVVPLLKSASADPILPKSYRPVALLPIMSKILEKVVFSQLIGYLEENDIIHPNLHGSRAGHDTSTALLQMYDRWVEELEENKMVGVLFCDQSAAFDLCDHSILLDKLELMGLGQGALDWVRSYLSCRSQSCFVDGELSTPIKLLELGVPQGSIRGPLLWLCFTCDQPDVVHNHPISGQDLHRGCQEQQQATENEGEHGGGHEGDNCGELVGYVDDGAYSVSHADPRVLSEVLTEKYSMLHQWMNNNKLVINPDKTHLMVIGSEKIARARQQVNMMAGEHCIKPTETEKLLGMNIHQSLKWNEHLANSKSSLLKQLNSRINGLKMISRNANFKTRLMIANGAVHSKVVSLITLWGCAQQYLLNAVQVKQLTAARTVCGFQSLRWSRARLLRAVGWLSIRQLVVYHTVLQAHKTLSAGRPSLLYDSFASQYPYQTRGATSGQIRLHENTSTKSFKYRAMVLYNSVPVDVRQGTLPTVKKKLKQWVVNNIPMDWS